MVPLDDSLSRRPKGTPGPTLSEQVAPVSKDRLTHVHSMLTWNPSPASAFKRFHLNICYYHQDLHWRSFHLRSPVGFSTASTPPPTRRCLQTKAEALGRSDGEVSATCLSAIHFRGRFIRQVSCYTLLSGCRLPWPPSCCLDESTPFMGSAEHVIWRLNLTFGSSPIAIPAYQVWPTKGLPHFTRGSQLRNPRCHTRLKFENKSRMKTFLMLLIIRFTRCNCGRKALAILRETSAGTSYQMAR